VFVRLLIVQRGYIVSLVSSGFHGHCLLLDVFVSGVIDCLRPTDCFLYRQFNIQQFHVLPTQCIYVFCVDLKTNSDYFPI